MSNFIKKNYYYLLFLIGFIFIMLLSNLLHNDLWFLLNCGKYVLNNGIPSIYPFSIHEGFNYIMQQWLSGVIFYFLYKFFGFRGLLSLLYLMSFIIMVLLYKICNLSVKNKKVSIILVLIFITMICKEFLTTRPQLFTFTFLLLEILLIELYIKNKNKKYLYLLPIISILEVNLHMSMWLFLFLFLMPYYAEYIFNIIFKKDNFKIKPIIIVSILMLLGGLINPYTYRCFTFIFESYGNSDVNSFINEMKNIFTSKTYLGSFICSLLLIGLLSFNKEYKKIRFRHLCLTLGCSILFILHIKCLPYYYISYFILLSDLLNNIKVEINIKKIIIFRIIFYCLIIILFSYLIINSYIKCNLNSDVDDSISYLLDKYDKEDIKLFIEFDYGGYAEFKGIKPYIDPIVEVYLKSMNNKEDIFSEYSNLWYGNISYDSFVKKYMFTHIIINNNDYFTYYLINNNNYILEYSDNYSNLFTLRSVYRD